MKPLFALLACLGFAAAGCSSEPAPVVPDASPDLGEPATMGDPAVDPAGDPGSTTGATEGPALGEP